MRVLHGSNKVIESPTFGWGNPNNDYGLGFYTTEDIALASEWAVGIDHDGYVNKPRLTPRKAGKGGGGQMPTQYSRSSGRGFTAR